jgi:hypothetical protein
MPFCRKWGLAEKLTGVFFFGTAQFGGLGLEHLAAYQGHNRL